MSSTATLARDAGHGDAFRHEALLYRGEQGFVAAVLPFIREAVRSNDAILVVVSARKIALLCEALGADADGVEFADMAEVGRNPARIIPVWREFVQEHLGQGRMVRGIGEPIHPDRREAELAECHHHESLLNLAFQDAPAWHLVCPYDLDALPTAVIDEAHRNHPYIRERDAERLSDRYAEAIERRVPFEGPLAPAPADAPGVSFGSGGLDALRGFVYSEAAAARLPMSRSDDLVLAVNEVATNSLRYGGGEGVLLMWSDADAVVCEIRDRGRFAQPLVGRVRPTAERIGGRGLWLVNQLCDLVQIRSSDDGTVVRLHMWLR